MDPDQKSCSSGSRFLKFGRISYACIALFIGLIGNCPGARAGSAGVSPDDIIAIDGISHEISTFLLSDAGAACADPASPESNPRFAMVVGDDGTRVKVSLVSPEEAQRLFQEVAGRNDIPFRYPEDGCFARAHAMARQLEGEGIATGKVFLEGDLHVETPNSPKGYVDWQYHVAPMLEVRNQEKYEIYVLDPSLFDKAVPLRDWIAIQTRRPQKDGDRVIFRSRFYYVPDELDREMTSYSPSDLGEESRTLEKYLRIQNQRSAGKQTSKGEAAKL